MQVYECRKVEMKRDMDLVRDLLLFIENDPRLDGTLWLSPQKPQDVGVTNHSIEEVAYHLTMLVEAGFVKGNTGMEMPAICKLTWNGHEFMDDIRDPDIWDKTKERTKGLTSVGLAFIWEIAKAEIKTKLGLP